MEVLSATKSYRELDSFEGSTVRSSSFVIVILYDSILLRLRFIWHDGKSCKEFSLLI